MRIQILRRAGVLLAGEKIIPALLTAGAALTVGSGSPEPHATPCRPTATLRVEGNSLAPRANAGAILRFTPRAAGCGTPNQGDLVVFRPQGSKRQLIKRVVAIPGDEITVDRRRNLLVNRRQVMSMRGGSYQFTTAQVSKVFGEPREWRIVPADEYLVLGEQRDGTILDSRAWGLIPSEWIFGIASSD